MELEFVVKEERRSWDWYYSTDEKAYVAQNRDKVVSKVLGKYLPNPAHIRAARYQIQKSLPINEQGKYRIEPDPTTIALYSHWLEQQDN